MNFRTRFRQHAKRLVYSMMRWLGANHVMRYRNRKLIRIFTLHGVADYEAEHRWTPLRDQFPVSKLSGLLERLTDEYDFISLDEAVRIIKGIDPPKENCAVLTFDDGYKNNFDVALPVLRKYSVPAAFYVATGFVESRQPFWFDRLDYVIQQASKQHLHFNVGDRRFEFEDNDRNRVKKKYAELRAYCKAKYNREDEFVTALDKLAEDLESLSGVSLAEFIETDQWAGVVSKTQLATVAQDELVTIGSHTVKHLRLNLATLEDARSELRESRAALQSWTGTEVRHFAYPNGGYDEVTIREVDAAGYVSAVTSDSGMNSIGDNIFALARLNLSPECSVSEMLGRASGLEVLFERLADKIRGR